MKNRVLGIAGSGQKAFEQPATVEGLVANAFGHQAHRNGFHRGFDGSRGSGFLLL
jgi:hypothetical protein